jgi:photosystem II stability/assembly factor-like uncharacterized protein
VKKGKRLGEILVFVLSAGILITIGLSSSRILGNGDTDLEEKSGKRKIHYRDRFYGIAKAEDIKIWLAGSNGNILQSLDGGESWEAQQTPRRYTLQDIACWDENRAVAVGDRGVVLVTDDGGKTWQEVEVPKSEIENKLFDVTTLENGEAYAVGAMGMILYTADWGFSWTRRGGEEDRALNSVAFTDRNTGVIVGEFGKVLKTVDGGETWAASTTSMEITLMAVSFRDGLNAVAVGLDGLVLKTADAGESWTACETGITQHLFEIFWDGKQWFTAGADGIIGYGDPECESWEFKKLSDVDWAWHTAVEKIGSGYLIVGASQGIWENGKWSYLGS